MKTIPILALTAVSIFGITAASAQAGEWHRGPARIIEYAPPVVICPPAPGPVVMASEVIRPAHYRPAVHYRHCR